MSETSSNWDGDYEHLFFSSLVIELFFSFFNYSLFSGKPVIHGRPVLAPGLGWVYPNWSKSEISPQLPNQQVWTWTSDIILANETNGGSSKDFLPWKRSPLLLGIVSGYDDWKWYNHLAASLELNLTLKLAAQKDGGNLSPWWYCWLLIFLKVPTGVSYLQLSC